MGKILKNGLLVGDGFEVREESRFQSVGETSFTRWKPMTVPARTEDLGFDSWEEDGGFSGMVYAIETDLAVEGNVCHEHRDSHARELIGRLLEKIDAGKAWAEEELGAELVENLKSYWSGME